MSTECRRFEAEGLERIERGEPLGDHFRECPPCRAAVAAHERLRTGLAALPPVGAPPDDWEARVWAEIRSRDKKRWTWRLAPIAAAGLAAALIATVWPGRVEQPGLQIQVRSRAAEVVRSVSARPGDVLQVRGTTGDVPHAELRVYRDGALIFRCGEASPCAREGDSLSAEVPLDSVGRHESILLLSDKPIASPVPKRPDTAAGMNPDLDAAIGDGAKVVTTGAVDVF